MQSNPFQQRVELICDKWEEAKKQTQARVVRIQCQDDESDMVDTFFNYMIGVDTPIVDIAFQFESSCYDQRSFSESILNELQEIIDVWNYSQKDERIEFAHIPWEADYSFQKEKNPAALFVKNFNVLAKTLKLPKGVYVVAIFKSGVVNNHLTSWTKNALEVGINDEVKFLVHDTCSNPQFDGLAFDSPVTLTTIPLDLNMPKAMEQAAAMGDPNDPATAYRQTFMKMMNAMTAQKEKEAERWGEECIKQATENLSRDPYWIMQIIVVHVALGNDKIRCKKTDLALEHANKAVETAVAAQQYFENETASILLAQAKMFRGTIQFVRENLEGAFTDFNDSFSIYRKQGNMALAVEACRMAGRSALENSEKQRAAKILAEGARLGKIIDANMARASTFTGLLELLLQTNHDKYISFEELDEIAVNIYGPDWNSVVNNWKKAMENNGVLEEEIGTTRG
jgi:hypothetical protein